MKKVAVALGLFIINTYPKLPEYANRTNAEKYGNIHTNKSRDEVNEMVSLFLKVENDQASLDKYPEIKKEYYEVYNQLKDVYLDDDYVMFNFFELTLKIKEFNEKVKSLWERNNDTFLRDIIRINEIALDDYMTLYNKATEGM